MTPPQTRFARFIFPAAIFILSLPFLALFPHRAEAQESASASYVYKTSGEVELKLFVYDQADEAEGKARPAIVFFFGGGFRKGTVKQFAPHAEHFSERGMVAVLVDYRVSSRHGTTPTESIEDGRTAIRWLRARAKKFGIDPDRIVGSGGSAGGMLAACCALLEGVDDPRDDVSVNPSPNALVLFNPGLFKERSEKNARFGADPTLISPHHNIKKNAPPTILFHGTIDTAVPYPHAVAFTKKMVEHGNECELVTYEGQDHGFFNFHRGDKGEYRDTLERADAFLVKLGYLD